MQSTNQKTSTKRVWAGRVISTLIGLFMVFDGVIKVMRLAPAVEGTAQLGYPAGSVVGIGIVALVCTVIYVIPQTAVLRAILLTGYLGGATATQVRVSAGLFPLLFPGIIAALLWSGLFLREERLRALLPLRT